MEEEKNKLPVVQDFPLEEVRPADTSRQMAEIQAQVIMAKKFPRDENAALIRIKKSCERKSLADQALFAYPRAGQTISGPSIRLLETVAQAWGNLDYGFRELSNDGEWSEAEAYAWDLEANTMVRKRFKVKLEIAKKDKTVKKLTDPRDIYEHVANASMRRVRACLEGVIPKDVVEDAVVVVKLTMQSNDVPIQEVVKRLIYSFEKYGVSKDLLEKRLGHGVEAMIKDQVVEYGQIFNSIKDGMTKREDWFDIYRAEDSDKMNAFKDKFKKDDQNSALDTMNKMDLGGEAMREAISNKPEVADGPAK